MTALTDRPKCHCADNPWQDGLCFACWKATHDPAFAHWRTGDQKILPAASRVLLANKQKRMLTARSACVHRLEPTGKKHLCPTCQGKVEAEEFGCKVHGKCLIDKQIAGIPCCLLCKDKAVPGRPHDDQTRARAKPCCGQAAKIEPPTVITRHPMAPIQPKPAFTQPSSMPVDLMGMFDRVVMINLKRRPDRIENFKRQQAEKGWPLPEPILFEAIDGNKVPIRKGYMAGGGAWGCIASHVSILQRAIMDDVGTILVFEDDLCWRDTVETELVDFFKSVPDDWDQVMLGGQVFSHEGVNDKVLRVLNGQRTHAFALRNEGMKSLLYEWLSCNTHCDHCMSWWHPKNRAYVPKQAIFGQDATRSDIGDENKRRYWTAVPPEDPGTPIIHLTAPIHVVRSLREAHGWHTGYSRDAKDLDVGLKEVKGNPSMLRNWLNVVIWEALNANGKLAVWHPEISLEFLRNVHNGQVIEVKGESADECLRDFNSKVNAKKVEIPAMPLAVFWHVACMNEWREVATEQLGLLAHVGLKEVSVCVSGSWEDARWLAKESVKQGVTTLKVLQVQPDLESFETPTLQKLWEHAKDNLGQGVLYFHTKGVSKPKGDPEWGQKVRWRQVLQAHLFGGWQGLLKKLERVDLCGLDWIENPEMPHFSGNFWMARTDWIAKLRSPEEHKALHPDLVIGGHPWKRMCSEMWLGSDGGHRVDSAIKNLELWRGEDLFDLPCEVEGFGYEEIPRSMCHR